MSDNLKAIQRLLPLLDNGELLAVRDQLRSLGIGSAPVAPAPGPAIKEDDAMLLLEVICEYMNAKGLDLSGPARMRQSTTYKSFTAKALPVVALFRRQIKNRLQLRGVLYIGVQSLSDNMQERRGWDVSCLTLMRFANEIPSAIEKAFPGYIGAGLLPMIIREKRSEERKRYVRDQ